MCLATGLKLLEQIIWKPQAIKFQLCSKCWTQNLLFHLHKSTPDKRNMHLKDTCESNRDSAKKHHKIWSLGTACPLEDNRTAPTVPLYPTARSKVSRQLEQQGRVLEINVRSIYFSDPVQYNYCTTIIKMMWKYILYFIRGQLTVLTIPFPKRDSPACLLGKMDFSIFTSPFFHIPFLI